MSAGLPGLGLGGLFFVLSALLGPALEASRTVRGRSSVAAWRQVGRQFAIAVGIVISVDLTVRGALLVGGALGVGDGPPAELTVIPLGPIAITLGLLAAVLAASKLAQLVMRLALRWRGLADRRRVGPCPRPCSCCPPARG